MIRSVSLDAPLDAAPNPLAPTARESITAALSVSEQERFLAHLTPALAEDRPPRRSTVACVTAAKRS